MPSFDHLAFDWPISARHGWGIYGKNLAMRLIADHRIKPIILGDIEGGTDLDPVEASILGPLKALYGGAFEFSGPRPRLSALNETLHHVSRRVEMTDRQIGVGFWESFGPDMDVNYVNLHCRGVIAGSDWNAERLRAKGVKNVITVLQGVDTALFCPGPQRGLFKGRYAIFSGGKLEYRKGQDIVVRAFTEFGRRHSDAILVTAWSNIWLDSAKTINASELTLPLRIEPGIPNPIEIWTAENGIPDHQIFHLPMMANHFMPQILRDCDLAVFPNRAEGGTNLVAMEAMACGLPTILSANTGHLHFTDALEPEMVIGGMAVPGPSRVGWSAVDWRDLLDCMEREYVTARPRVEPGFIHALTWENQVTELLAAIERLLT